MSTYDKARTIIVVALCGFIPFAWGVLLDGESADRSAGWWVIFLSGLLVIAVGSIVVESLYRNRHAKSPEAGRAGAAGLRRETTAGERRSD